MKNICFIQGIANGSTQLNTSFKEKSDVKKGWKVCMRSDQELLSMP